MALLYYLYYNLALTTFPPPKRLGYGIIHARTFTQVGHRVPSLVAITFVVHLVLNMFGSVTACLKLKSTHYYYYCADDTITD